MNKDIQLIELVVEYIEDKITNGSAPNELVLKLGDRLAELTQPQLIKDAPVDTLIRIFGGTLLDPHWETSGTENTEGVIGYLNKERDTAQVQLSSYEVYNPTHFLPVSELIFEDLRKIYV